MQNSTKYYSKAEENIYKTRVLVKGTVGDSRTGSKCISESPNERQCKVLPDVLMLNLSKLWQFLHGKKWK